MSDNNHDIIVSNKPERDKKVIDNLLKQTWQKKSFVFICQSSISVRR